jgi:5-formyltetrahydrofolate cyclo-ligase
LIRCTDLDDAKATARRLAARQRADADPALGVALAECLLAELPPPAGARVAGYWPIGREIDIRPLLSELHRRGHVVGLPVTPPRGRPLGFQRWTPGVVMVPGRFGTMYPDAEAVVPDLLLVPLLAFDRHGRRLGYGGGYYDRTLAALPAAQAIGCAYAAQEIEHVPVEPHDTRLHAIATERGVIRAAG